MEDNRKRGPGSRGSSHFANVEVNEKNNETKVIQKEKVNDTSKRENQKQTLKDKKIQEVDYRDRKDQKNRRDNRNLKFSKNSRDNKFKRKSNYMNYQNEIENLKKNQKEIISQFSKTHKTKNDIKPLIFNLVSMTLSLLALLIAIFAYLH